MGRQSTRLYFQEYDHSGIAMADEDIPALYNHAKMYKGNRLLWKRSEAAVVAFRNTTGPNLYDGGSYISTSDDFEHFSVMQYGISIPGLSARNIRNPSISGIITFAGHYVCSYSYTNTLENKKISLLLRSEDGYAWKTIEDFYTVNIGWIGKGILDGRECLAVLSTGTDGSMNSNIVAYYYDSEFVRKKYLHLTNVVGKFSLNVYGYETLHIYYQPASSLYMRKITVKNGIKISEEIFNEDPFTSQRRSPDVYNYANDSLYSMMLYDGKLVTYRLGEGDVPISILTYDAGELPDNPHIDICYSDADSIVIEIANYTGEPAVYIEIKNDSIVRRSEQSYFHVFTSNRVSLVAKDPLFPTITSEFAMVTDLFNKETMKDIKVKGLNDWYNKNAAGFLNFAYLSRTN